MNRDQQYALGQKIKFTWNKKHLEGMIISKEGNRIVVKLKSGYNISIVPEEIELIGVIENRQKFDETRTNRLGKGKPISLITTGGTIVSKVDYQTGAVFPSLDIGEITSRFKYMEEKYSINRVEFSNILSENMEPDQWIGLVRTIKNELKSSDGVVISHGTDTMSYTASALSFMFEEQTGPIIIVGSQRSSDRPSSDSYLNLEAAIGFSGTDFGEVGISMHHNTSDEKINLIRGVRSRKMHSTRRDAFKAIGEGPVGLFQDGLINFNLPYRKSGAENILNDKLEKRVGIIYFYPGLETEDLEKFMDGKKGVVIMGTGLGHINTKYLDAIGERVKGGMKVITTTQCINGTTDIDIYSTGRQMKNAGILGVGNMLPETAYVKMMYVLANYSIEDFENVIKTNMRGEILDRESVGDL
jgi:glutamyl-tRNA(Gln) amidotransferase subunit D